jgi:2-amino-4-hydroxy-6-hydroxymethyldihydropteridine diphosphokinase
MTKTYQTIIALGSNLGDKKLNIETAIVQIKSSLGSVISVSNFYYTSPVGGNADQEFLNGAVLIETDLPPDAQLRKLLAIEKNLGRERKVHWGNRTLDLDIVGISKDGSPITVNTELLVCPHPRADERDFMLVPASEVAPDYIHPHHEMSLEKLVNLKNYSLNSLTHTQISS